MVRLRLTVAYEILCLSALQCTEWWHGSKKKGMPDSLSLLNVNNTCHLERLMWAVYDGALLVGLWPKLPGNHPWCTVLAGLYKHIYRGCNDMVHCLPYTLASWDCQEWTEALHQEGRLSSVWSGQWRASRARRRSRSSSRCHSWTLTQGGWSRHSCGLPPNMLSSCHHGGPSSPYANTMPRLASAVNVPSSVWSSHSGGGMAQASLGEEDTWEDDFQIPHTPVHHIVQWDGGGCGELAPEWMDASRRSSSWQPYYQVNIGEEEAETLESIDPHWRATCWLQMMVQDITEEEVPWYELVLPLMSGAEGTTLSLAKCLLVVWRWSIKV